jgi:hypothetical protein
LEKSTGIAVTEEYDGTSWTAGGNLNTARAIQEQVLELKPLSFLLVDMVLILPSTSLTELYDGTSWTNGGKLNLGRSELAGAGTQTSGLVFAGEPTTKPQKNLQVVMQL